MPDIAFCKVQSTWKFKWFQLKLH